MVFTTWNIKIEMSNVAPYSVIDQIEDTTIGTSLILDAKFMKKIKNTWFLKFKASNICPIDAECLL